MSQVIYALTEYDLLNLNNNYVFKMPSGQISYGPDECHLYFYPENHTFEEIEEIFNNPNNTKRIQNTNIAGTTIYNTLDNYIIVTNIKKLYHEVVYREFDDNGVYNEKYADIFSVSLRKQNPNDKIPQMEATMEYIAIMADIDIDEE